MPALVSVLIPIYNSAKYLQRCLTSVTNQTLQDLEIICINDGSTDNSLSIIQNYAKEDNRIIIIDKPNTGYGDSMNQGLKKAEGEYIGIVEPDDWIETNAFEKLYNSAQEYCADVVKANYYTEKSGQTSSVQDVTKLQIIDRRSTIRPRAEAIDFADYQQVFKFAPAIWSAIYRRDFLKDNKIDFLPTPGASYQDVSFYFKVWTLAQKIVLLPDKFIHYRLDNENSSVNSPGKVDCVVREYEEILDFLTTRGLLENYGHLMAEAKFRNYHWNLQRLSPRLAKEFYQKFRDDMLKLQDQGFLVRSDFTKQHWLALQAILKHPQFAYRALRIRSKIH